MQPRRRRLPARDEQPRGARIDRRSGLPDRIGCLQHRIQRSAAPAARALRVGAGSRGARQPQRRRGEGQPGRRAHRHGRHPADAHAGTPLRPLDERVDAVSGAQRLDLHRARRGHPSSTSPARSGSACSRRRSPPNPLAPACNCTSRCPPPTSRRTGMPRRCWPGRRWRSGANSPYFFGHQLWAETRIELFGQATDTRPDELKTQGVRPAGVVRRALDHVDLRPVRGERPVLPVAAARGVRGGPGRRARGGPHAEPARTAAAQRHDLPMEPPGVRRGRWHAAPSGGEPGAARRADGGGHAGELGVLLRAAAHAVR